jgi:hypothetical protein
MEDYMHLMTTKGAERGLVAGRSVLVALIAASTFACTGETGGDIGSTRSEMEAEWEAYRALAVPVANGLIAEGDLFFEDEDALQDHFYAITGDPYALASEIAPGGGTSRWPTGMQRNIRYCMDGSFGAFAAEARNALHAAARAWESRANVDFFHAVARDGATCNGTDASVDFHVSTGPAGSAYVIGGPDVPRSERAIVIDPDEPYDPPFTLENQMIHHLGHMLGFAHENSRMDAPAVPGCPRVPLATQTSFDPFSAMQQPLGPCRGPEDPAPPSPRDHLGAARVYGEGISSDRLVGDFNGDGLSDVAMWRSGWGSIPIYFGRTDGTFYVTNIGTIDNRINTISNGVKLVGDFDGDGRSDILVADATFLPLQTLVYYSNGDGGFTAMTITQTVDLVANARARYVGKFDSDADSDIMLVIPSDTSVRVMRPNARGAAFTVTTTALAAGQRWITDFQASRMPGDYDGDGLLDIALWKEGWSSTPIYFSNGTGGFVITNAGHGPTTNWINDPVATRIVGRYGTNNRSGILLWRPGWTTAPTYFSSSTPTSRTGAFTTTNNAAPNINRRDVTKIPGDFDGDGITDIMLVDYAAPATLEILFSNGNGVYSHNSMTVLNLVTGAAESKYVAFRSANPLVGRFSSGPHDDVLLWRSDWNSNPIMFGNLRFVMHASNNADSSNFINTR